MEGERTPLCKQFLSNSSLRVFVAIAEFILPLNFQLRSFAFCYDITFSYSFGYPNYSIDKVTWVF